MSVVRRALRMIGMSILAAGAGGIAAGLILALTTMASTPFDPPDVGRAFFGLIVVLFLLLLTASVGAGFGIVAGFAPTLLLGALLAALNSRRPFRHVGFWASAGAAAGWVCASLNLFGLGQIGTGVAKNDMTIHWIIAGAVSMGVYWELVRRFPLGGRQERADLRM